MKSVRITFRLSPYQLARGLQTIKQLEPKYKLISLNDIVKTIYHDYLAKMSMNKNENIPLELMTEITSFISRPSSKSLDLDDLLNLQSPKPEQTQTPISEPEQEEKTTTHHDFDDPENESDLTDKILTEINTLSKINQQAEIHNLKKASEFNDPNETESDISSLTDFTPPTDWEK